MFEPASIWDIPLVKPRFGCAFDMSMAVKGYDMAAALEAQLSHFMSGSNCELGFMHMQQTHLLPKANIEFGFPTGREMPVISEARLRVSVVFYAGRGVSPTLLDASISSVVARFPEAAEVVVVLTEAPTAPRDGLMDVVNSHAQEAPFPVEIVEEDAPFLSPRGGWPGWSGLGVDDIASGEFVMQLEVGDILVEDVAYDNIFHFRKPVIPFLRLSLGGGDAANSLESECVVVCVCVCVCVCVRFSWNSWREQEITEDVLAPTHYIPKMLMWWRLHPVAPPPLTRSHQTEIRFHQRSAEVGSCTASAFHKTDALSLGLRFVSGASGCAPLRTKRRIDLSFASTKLIFLSCAVPCCYYPRGLPVRRSHTQLIRGQVHRLRDRSRDRDGCGARLRPAKGSGLPTSGLLGDEDVRQRSPQYGG